MTKSLQEIQREDRERLANISELPNLGEEIKHGNYYKITLSNKGDKVILVKYDAGNHAVIDSSGRVISYEMAKDILAMEIFSKKLNKK